MKNITGNLTFAGLREGLVFLVDKPVEWTSFDVIAKLRGTIKKKLNIRKYKIGHAGTLDPLATGLLIICTGRLTKSIHVYQDMEKEYSGVITLGATTPSFDLETPINEVFPLDHITTRELEHTRLKLTGEILQKVPVYSAIKVDGQRMYHLARKGEEVQMKSRIVNVHSFDMDSDGFPDIRFRLTVSKGTYVRAIADDFGRLTGSGGYLAELRRTRIGNYNVSDAWKVENLVQTIQDMEETETQ